MKITENDLELMPHGVKVHFPDGSALDVVKQEDGRKCFSISPDNLLNTQAGELYDRARTGLTAADRELLKMIDKALLVQEATA